MLLNINLEGSFHYSAFLGKIVNNVLMAFTLHPQTNAFLYALTILFIFFIYLLIQQIFIVLLV